MPIAARDLHMYKCSDPPAILAARSLKTRSPCWVRRAHHSRRKEYTSEYSYAPFSQLPPAT